MHHLFLFVKYLNYRSLWYISYGFELHFESSREAIGTAGQCLLKYNNKGGQIESVISAIKLKQLFVPFTVLICGYLLACFQFLRELIHAHFERQMNKVENVSVIVTTGDGIESSSRDSKPTTQQHDTPSFLE